MNHYTLYDYVSYYILHLLLHISINDIIQIQVTYSKLKRIWTCSLLSDCLLLLLSSSLCSIPHFFISTFFILTISFYPSSFTISLTHTFFFLFFPGLQRMGAKQASQKKYHPSDSTPEVLRVLKYLGTCVLTCFVQISFIFIDVFCFYVLPQFKFWHHLYDDFILCIVFLRISAW